MLNVIKESKLSSEMKEYIKEQTNKSINNILNSKSSVSVNSNFNYNYIFVSLFSFILGYKCRMMIR